jgi:hypothetical protein
LPGIYLVDLRKQPDNGDHGTDTHRMPQAASP